MIQVECKITYRTKVDVSLKLFSCNAGRHAFLALIIVAMFNKLLAYLRNLKKNIHVTMLC